MGPTDDETCRQIDELMGRPALAPIKALADNLVDCILRDLRAGVPIDPGALFRMCAGTVVLADSEGVRRQGELTQAKADHVRSLQALVETQRESIALQAGITRQLEDLVAEQEGIIAEQRRLIDLLQGDGAEGRTPRLH